MASTGTQFPGDAKRQEVKRNFPKELSFSYVFQPMPRPAQAFGMAAKNQD
jgi:hypothetical protein